MGAAGGTTCSSKVTTSVLKQYVFSFGRAGQGLQADSHGQRLPDPKGCQFWRHGHLPVQGLQRSWHHPHQHQRLRHWCGMFSVFFSSLYFSMRLTSPCVHVLYCFQSCPPRFSARTGVCTPSWRPTRPRWSAKPSVLRSPKSCGEDPTLRRAPHTIRSPSIFASAALRSHHRLLTCACGRLIVCINQRPNVSTSGL